jgi:hypothetical protein
MVQPLNKALEHFMGHIMQAEAKGMDSKMISQFRSAAEQAFSHLTAGHGTPPPEGLIPAAAGGTPSPAAGGRTGRVALGQSREFGKLEGEVPTQFGMVNDVANPPKPPTAG